MPTSPEIITESLLNQLVQTDSTIPTPLAEKYRPRAIGEFIGLDKPKQILAKFAANPYQSAWIFIGPPGRGKTTMALALSDMLSADVHHVPSQQCNVANVEDVIRQCWYVPMSGGFHVVLVDEADKMSNAAQLHFLSKLDATAFPPQTIFIFTCNTTEGLESRFLSRTRQVEFSSYGTASEATRLLESIWLREANGASSPNFARIVKESSNNIRDALMCLETELLAS
jgi:replication-associated recombination protein RarA